MALAAQALEANKAWKPLEYSGALEQVAARIKRVMGLTFKVTGAQTAGEASCLGVPVDRNVSRHFVHQ